MGARQPHTTPNGKARNLAENRPPPREGPTFPCATPKKTGEDRHNPRTGRPPGTPLEGGRRTNPARSPDELDPAPTRRRRVTAPHSIGPRRPHNRPTTHRTASQMQRTSTVSEALTHHIRAEIGPVPRRDRSGSASRSVQCAPSGAAVLRKIASRSRVAVRGLCQGLNGLPRGATGTAGPTRPVVPRGVVPSCAESRLRPSGRTLKIRPRCLRHDRGGPQKRGTARDHSPGWVIPGQCRRAVRIAPPNVNDG